MPDLTAQIIQGDCIASMRGMPEQSVNCCVTSPPYFGLRDYGHDGQIGLEQTPDEYVSKLVEVFREVRRVLRDDGTLWVNLGDSYSGSGKGVWNAPDERKSNIKETYRPSINPSNADTGLAPKNLIGIPWRVAFALQSDGWYLRQDIIWHKPNPMPESVTDRCTKAHEYLFLLAKSERYWFDSEANKEQSVGVWNSKQGFGGDVKKSAGDPLLRTQGYGTHHDDEDKTGRNRRSVWTIPTQPYSGAHFATFPPALVEPCILAGCPAGGMVLDPFMGSGTTAAVALKNGRNAIGCELNPEYVELARARIGQQADKYGLFIPNPMESPCVQP